MRHMDDMKRKRIIHISTKNLQSTDCSIMPWKPPSSNYLTLWVL